MAAVASKSQERPYADKMASENGHSNLKISADGRDTNVEDDSAVGTVVCCENHKKGSGFRTWAVFPNEKESPSKHEQFLLASAQEFYEVVSAASEGRVVVDRSCFMVSAGVVLRDHILSPPVLQVQKLIKLRQIKLESIYQSLKLSVNPTKFFKASKVFSEALAQKTLFEEKCRQSMSMGLDLQKHVLFTKHALAPTIYSNESVIHHWIKIEFQDFKDLNTVTPLLKDVTEQFKAVVVAACERRLVHVSKEQFIISFLPMQSPTIIDEVMSESITSQGQFIETLINRVGIDKTLILVYTMLRSAIVQWEKFLKSTSKKSERAKKKKLRWRNKQVLIECSVQPSTNTTHSSSSSGSGCGIQNTDDLPLEAVTPAVSFIAEDTRAQEALKLYKVAQARIVSMEQTLDSTQQEMKKLEAENEELLTILKQQKDKEQIILEQARMLEQSQQEVKRLEEQQAALMVALKQQEATNHDSLEQARVAADREKELLRQVHVLQRGPISREDVSKMEDAVLRSLLEFIPAEQVQRKLCVVCLDSDARILFLPCRHQKVCALCAKVCAVCPYCQQVVQQRILPF